jgi:hypothetical protein
MNKRLLPVLLLFALTGCVDGLGIGSACETEMQKVRRQHGPPDRQVMNQRSAIWEYYRPGGNLIYEFSWGSAGEPCRVVGPVSGTLLDDRPLLLQLEGGMDAGRGADRRHLRRGDTR